MANDLVLYESPEAALTKANQLKEQIETAQSVEEAVYLKHGAEAVLAYAKAKKLPGLAVDAKEAQLRAERKAGEFLATAPKAAGGQPYQSQHATSRPAQTLEDMGITKSDSSRWQQMARIPDAIFNAWIATQKVDDGELTQAGALREAREWIIKEQFKLAQETLDDGMEEDHRKYDLTETVKTPEQAEEFLGVYDKAENKEFVVWVAQNVGVRPKLFANSVKTVKDEAERPEVPLRKDVPIEIPAFIQSCASFGKEINSFVAFYSTLDEDAVSHENLKEVVLSYIDTVEKNAQKIREAFLNG